MQEQQRCFPVFPTVTMSNSADRRVPIRGMTLMRGGGGPCSTALGLACLKACKASCLIVDLFAWKLTVGVFRMQFVTFAYIYLPYFLFFYSHQVSAFPYFFPFLFILVCLTQRTRKKLSTCHYIRGHESHTDAPPHQHLYTCQGSYSVLNCIFEHLNRRIGNSIMYFL